VAHEGDRTDTHWFGCEDSRKEDHLKDAERGRDNNIKMNLQDVGWKSMD
jgi:hypothetical protein